jgi:hypothetical protein
MKIKEITGLVTLMKNVSAANPARGCVQTMFCDQGGQFGVYLLEFEPLWVNPTLRVVVHQHRSLVSIEATVVDMGSYVMRTSMGTENSPELMPETTGVLARVTTSFRSL